VINNFIPHYIVSWKWKRLLIGEGVSFAGDNTEKETNSHTRIELPKSAKQVSHYISKYMSKAYELPGDFGYISGHSSILNNLPEVIIFPDNAVVNEIEQVVKQYKIIKHDYVSIVCVDLLKVKDKFPGIDKEFGEIIMSTLYSNDSKRLHRSEYDTVKKDFSKFGLIVLGKIGAFQTKYHFKHKSELSLIEFSISMLDVYARDNPDKLIGLTFPGINYGKLSEEDVLPFLETLPDNVRIYKYAVC